MSNADKALRHDLRRLEAFVELNATAITKIEANGILQPFEPALNFLSPLTVTNNPGNKSNDVGVVLPVGQGTLIGAFSTRPAQPQPAGLVFVPTDGPLKFISNGASWLPYFNDVEYLGSPVPAAANFTEIAAGQSTLADSVGTLLLTVSGTNADIWQYNPVLTSTYTLDFAFECLWAHDGGGADQPVTGVCLRDSTNGHFYRIAMYYDRSGSPDFHMQVQRFTAIGAASTVISDILNTGIMKTAGPVRFRVTFAAGTYSLFTTQDGGTFGSPQATWVTEAFAAPDHWGIYLNGGNGAPVVIPTRFLSIGIAP